MIRPKSFKQRSSVHVLFPTSSVASLHCSYFYRLTLTYENLKTIVFTEFLLQDVRYGIGKTVFHIDLVMNLLFRVESLSDVKGLRPLW